MKKIILTLSILHSLIGFSQSNKIFIKEYVECYYDNKIHEPLKIYNEIDGALINTLIIEKGEERHKWFKLAILETRKGWAKIKNILAVPGRNDSLNSSLKLFENKWVKIENLKINIADISLPDSLGVPFYKEPDINAKLICKSGKFLRLTLIETKGIWAKVSFIYNQIKYIAWIERKNQCAYPWTSCPFNP